MKTFSITMISLVAAAGMAFAQGAPKQPDPKAGAGAGVGVGVKAGAGGGAGAGTGSAAAGAKAGTTATAGGTTQAGATVQAGAGAKMEMPKPPAEIAATLKMMGTRSNCKGTGLGMDMKTMVDFKGTGTAKLALDGWWIQSSMNGTIGKGKESMKMKMESYMTYDAKSAKWRTVSLMNDGMMMHGWAEMKDGKFEATAETTGMMGAGMFKEHGDMTDPKAGMKMWGEMSMDKGKTWTKVYEMTCKK